MARGSTPTRTLLALVAGALAVTSCGSRTATHARPPRVTHAWARPTPERAQNGVIYLDVASGTSDTLTSASVPTELAARAELHETMGAAGGGAMANMPNMAAGASGGMTMVPLDSVAVPAGRAVHFEPGGRHIMLTGLLRPLHDGDVITLTLTFTAAGPVTVQVPVRDNAP
jgi:copper(I)-binding protein